jgi:hypothetical protein
MQRGANLNKAILGKRPVDVVISNYEKIVKLASPWSLTFINKKDIASSFAKYTPEVSTKELSQILVAKMLNSDVIARIMDYYHVVNFDVSIAKMPRMYNTLYQLSSSKERNKLKFKICNAGRIYVDMCCGVNQCVTKKNTDKEADRYPLNLRRLSLQ